MAEQSHAPYQETVGEFVDWLVSLDDITGQAGADRRQVTLTRIISRARAARDHANAQAASEAYWAGLTPEQRQEVFPWLTS